MTVFVLGGSNSMYQDGWIARFTASQTQQVVNLSVGATTTLTGIYRLMLDDRPRPGDTVLWEYALNEATHAQRGQSTEVLLKNVEHLIAICQHRHLQLLPAIFTPRRQERAPARSPYYDQLLALFAHYGLPVFDLSPVWRAAHGQPKMPVDLYADPVHYRRDTELMDFIAAGLAAIQPRQPRAALPLRTHGARLQLLTGFARQRFSNSVMDIPAARLLLRLRTKEDSRMIALFTICQPRPHEAGLSLRLKPATGREMALRISISSRGAFPRSVLKAISIEQGSSAAWLLGPDAELVIKPLTQPGRAFAEAQTKSRLKRPEPVTTPCVTGLLVEIGGNAPAPTLLPPSPQNPSRWRILSPVVRLMQRLRRKVRSRAIFH